MLLVLQQPVQRFTSTQGGHNRKLALLRSNIALVTSTTSVRTLHRACWAGCASEGWDRTECEHRWIVKQWAPEHRYIRSFLCCFTCCFIVSLYSCICSCLASICGLVASWCISFVSCHAASFLMTACKWNPGPVSSQPVSLCLVGLSRNASRVLGPDKYGIFRANTNIGEHENSDIRYIGWYYTHIY